MNIIVSNGSIRFIYDDQLLPLTHLGETTIKRASHVEPCSGGWQVDLSPVQGPLLGPFETRNAALSAEIVWLKQHNIPIPN